MADERTEVLSLDELMDLASEPSTPPTVEFRRPEARPAARPVAATPTPAPTRTPAPLNPAAPKPTPTPQPHVALADRLEPVLDEAREFLVTAKQWLRQGDNGLIAATAFIALLLLVVVASL